MKESTSLEKWKGPWPPERCVFICARQRGDEVQAELTFLWDVEQYGAEDVQKKRKFSHFSASLPRYHMLFLVSCPVPFKLVRNTTPPFSPPPQTRCPGKLPRPIARMRSNPARLGQPSVWRPSPKTRALSSLVLSFPTSLTCGARALSISDPLGLRRLLPGSFRHGDGSYGYSSSALCYFRFRERGLRMGWDLYACADGPARRTCSLSPLLGGVPVARWGRGQQ